MSGSNMARLNSLSDANPVDDPVPEPAQADEVVVEDGQIIGEGQQTGEQEHRARRLTFDLNDLEGLEDVDADQDIGDDLTLGEFIKYSRNEPQALYKVLSTRWAAEKEEYERSINKLKCSAERKLRTKDEALVALIDERDELRQTLERLTIRFVNSNDAGAAPPVQKGPKIPDTKKLKDGKNPNYESWKTDVRGKLRAMKSQYNTPESRILYVKSLCEGEASDHLMARMRDDAVDPFLDADDMFDHLDTIYLDANREINAKTEFRQLMQKTTRFQTFLSKFNLLALDAKKARSEWKEELYHKLNPEMKRAMIREANDPTCEYNEFVRACNLVANRLEQIAKEEKSAAKDNKGGQAAKDDKASKLPGGQGGQGSRGGSARAPRVPLSQEELDKLKEDQLCFNCKQPGHINRNCPLRKKPTADVKNVEGVEDGAEGVPENDQA